MTVPERDEESLTMVSAINQTLITEMRRDERVMVFGKDVVASGGAFRATEGLLDEFGSDRVVDMSVTEASILGVAAGLAAGGMIPVPEIQFLGASHQAMHQLADQIARIRYRTRGRLSMGITIRAPFGGIAQAPELQRDSVEGQLANIAGLKIVMPATATDAKGLLTEAIRDPDPVLFLEPLRGYTGIRGPVPTGEHRVPFGQARWAVPGDDATIIAWSYQVELATRVARRFAEQGVSVGVLDLRTLVPLDVASIVAAAERTGRVIVVEEGPPTGGFAAEIIATITEHAFHSLVAAPVRVSGFDTPYPAPMLEDTYVPDARRLEAIVTKLLRATPR